MNQSRLDQVRKVMTAADFDECQSIMETFGMGSTWKPRNWRRDEHMTYFYLAIGIYYRRMRRHSSRFQNLFAAGVK